MDKLAAKLRNVKKNYVIDGNHLDFLYDLDILLNLSIDILRFMNEHISDTYV